MARAGSVDSSGIKRGLGGAVKRSVDGLFWSCCRLTLPRGRIVYGGNIRMVVIPILTQMLDCGERVAGCWRRKRR